MSQVTSHVDDLHASGFCVQKLAMKAEDREAMRSDIPNDYQKMINNQNYSDVTLIRSDGRELYAQNIIPASAVVIDCDNVVNGDYNKYEDVIELISDGDNESEGSTNMEVDFETVWKSTEIRLQDKKGTSYSEKIENSTKDESNCLQNFDVHIDSKLCSYHDTEISKTDVSVASINNSSADLFGSPTPRKESIPVRQQSEYTENKSSFETPTTAPGRGLSFSTPIAKEGSDKEVAYRRELHDIWDDFDDCGIEYIPPVTSAVLSSPPDASDKVLTCDVTPSNTATDRLLLQDGEDSFVINIEDDPTPEGTSGVPESKEQTFETPSFKKRCKDKKRPWTAPSPFTPKPEYDKMATPVLKKAVQRIGVKVVGKKRMIKFPDDVFHQTHQYETDSNCEDDLPTGTQMKSGTQRSEAAIGDGVDGIVVSQESMSSQDSDMSELLEESCFYLPSSDSDASSSPQKSSDVNRSLFDFIKKRPELNNRILMYDPLELHVLKKDVKEAGIKCSMDKLMSFLDEKCIVFTKRNTRKRVNSQRDRKKDSTKEGSLDIFDQCRDICQTENKN